MPKEKALTKNSSESKKSGEKITRSGKSARKAAAPPSGKLRRADKVAPPSPRKEPTKPLFDAASRLAKQLDIGAVFVYAQNLTTNPEFLQVFPNETTPILVVKNDEEEEACRGFAKNVIRVPDVNLSRMDQVKLAVVIGLTEGVLGVGDRILCLVGRVDRAIADTLVLLDVGEEFETMNMHGQLVGTQEIDSKVFEATLTMALEMANEGREGYPIGTIFVIGDIQEVLRYSRQMIINPFQGHPESKRNIMDPKLRETVKGFSSLDGALVIRKDGVLVAAGRHLNAAYDGDALPPGLGARHAAAAAITAVTQALALTISASTGTVTIFREGKVIMTLERFRPAPSLTDAPLD